ncbi:hypothetical protein TSMEX_000401 [Taenia solium]|eukprot:TsM_000383700 transcript=TsM_000383700 gene=TsM_000383700
MCNKPVCPLVKPQVKPLLKPLAAVESTQEAVLHLVSLTITCRFQKKCGFHLKSPTPQTLYCCLISLRNPRL